MDLIMEGKDTSGLYYKGKQYTTADAFKIRGTSSCGYKVYSSRSSAGTTKQNYTAVFYLRLGSANRFSLFTFNNATRAYTAVTTVPTQYYLKIQGPVIRHTVASPTSNIVLKQYAEGMNSFYFAYRTGTTPTNYSYPITSAIIYGKDDEVVTDHYFVLATTSSSYVYDNQLYYMSNAYLSNFCSRISSKAPDASSSSTYYTTTLLNLTHTLTKYSNLVTLPISINNYASSFCPTMYRPCITTAGSIKYTATLV